MPDTRTRIMNSSAELLRRNGYAGTGLKRIAAEADAPFGSIYHFFPGGKEQLADESIRASGATYADLFAEIMDPAPDLLSGVAAVFTGAARTLVETDFADACPIATVALEVASTNDTLRRATADVFDGWVRAGVPRFARWGLDSATSRSLTLALITGLEGGFVLSRAQRSTEALEAAGASVVAATRAALAATSPDTAATNDTAATHETAVSHD